MNRSIVALFASMVFAVFATADDKALERDRKALQGVWVVDAAYRDGEKLSDNDRMGGAILYAIKVQDNKFQIALEKSGDEFKYGGDPVSYSLDVSVEPKVIEFEFSNTDKVYCIYTIKDDKLTICFNYQDGPLGDSSKDRSKLPKKLETKKGDGSYMFVLKKAK